MRSVLEYFPLADLEKMLSQVSSSTVMNAGHSCPNFPESRRTPPSYFDLYEDGVLPDLCTYEPTLPATISMLALGDLTERGCYPDWAKAEEFHQSNLDVIRWIQHNIVFYWLTNLMLVKASGNSFNI